MSRRHWEDKGERDRLKDQPRRWGGRLASQMEWSVNSEGPRPPGPPSPPPRQRATPSPIDYRSESRRRHDNHDAGVAQGGAVPPHDPRPSLLGPPPTHYTGSWPIMPPPSMYPDADRGHHAVPHYSSRWSQAYPGCFQSARGQYAFDMKWWSQQKQSMDAYLDGPSWGNDGKGAHPNTDMPQWSFGTRVMKNSRRHYQGRPGYGAPRGMEPGAYEEAGHHHQRSSAASAHPASRSGRSGVRSGHHMDYPHRRDRSHSPTDPRRHPHPSTHSQPSRSRDSSLDFRRKGYAERNDPRRSSSNPPEPGAEGSSGGKKRGKTGKEGQWDVPGSFKSHSSPSKSIRPLSTNGPLGLGRGGPSWPTHKGKKTKKASASYAEAAKKKALAAAASKLRQTFLASKKKSSGGENSLLEESEGNEGPGRSPCDDNNAQDLTMPRRHPSCLEFDIDIRFSAKEWASVGRGQGGAAGVLADPQGSSVPGKHLHKGNNLGEEQEDSGTYSDTDVGRNDSHWSPLPGPDQASSSSTRRRHLSESSGVIDLRKNPPSRGSASRPVSTRTRSCSLSLVEGGPGTSRGAQQGGSHPSRIKLHLMPKLRHLMLKQLLCMDKKSLQELVDDPRSRKAQFMMSHLMSEHRAALSQRLAQQRFKTPDALADDELQLLNSMEGAQLSSLPPEVVQQVREILALEQEGGEGVWEAATISLSDLLLSCDSDPECQIVSPPPRDPTSTITIHDTDSEMEELPEEEEHEYEEDEEDEEVESDHELTEGHVSLVANDDSEMEEIEEDGLDDGVEDDSEEEDREKQHQQQHPQEDQAAPPPLASISTNSSCGNSITNSNSIPIRNIDDTTATTTAITTTTTPNNNTNTEADATEGSVVSKIEVPPTPPPAASVAAKPTPAAPPLPLLPQIPVEVPMCVMEPLAPGAGRELGGPVRDAAMSLLASPPPPLSARRPAPGIPPGPGPSSLLLKVKEERPSPVSECGLCMHHPHTPHTAECVFPYGLSPPSPVALMPGPPRPLGVTPPQRPVPHIPPQHPLSASLYQRSIKQEKLDESYLKYDHVKRPSSEERPKNPAPPDALPTLHPAVVPGLHPAPQPRPLIFSPENDFPDPPRPPPPPPPQFSPRIKVERHTPVQFMCCCMRNECERSSSHSAEMRPPSRRAVATPQPSERRPTPHLYKMEPPSPCASRARTPHPSPPTLFAPPCASRARTPHPSPPTLFAPPCASRARTPHPPPPTLFASSCASRSRTPHPPHLPLPTLFAPPLASPRSGISGVEARVSNVEAKVSIGVQTEREVRVPVFLDSSPSSRKLYIPNLNLARSVTPFITTKVDQSTSTDDLPWDPFQPHPSQPLLPVQQQQQQQQRSKSRAKGWWWHRTGRPKNHMAQLAAISNSLSNFEWSSEAGAALQQMAVLGEQEGELLRHADLLDQDVHDLLRERRRVTEELARLQQLRAGKLRQLVQQSGSGQEGAEGPGPRGPTGDSRPSRVSQQDSSSDGGEPVEGANSSVANPAESLSQRYGGAGRGDACVQSTTDNASVVSSSQEKTPRVRSFSFSHTSSNDSSNESQSVRRQRCTSTCHSPGRNQKSRESQQGHLQGSNSHGEDYFQVEGSVAHLILHPSASTDSEAENDTRALRASVDSSEAKAAVSESQNSNRNRMSSLSSSAEGDTESEAPPDPDQDDKVPSLALDMTLDEGEAVVDSSERPDDKLDNDPGHPEDPAETSSGAHQGDPGPSKSQELQQIQKMEIVEDSGTSHKHEETVSTLIVFCTKPEPPDSPQKPVTPPPTSAHPSHPLSYLKSEPQSTPQLTDTERLKSEEQETVHPPSSVKCEGDMLALSSHLPIASTSQAASDRDTLTNTHKKTCLSSSSPSSSPMSSPESLKSRYTSSEHCYSLRSRGPPRRMRQVPQRPSGDNQEEEKKAIDKPPEEQPGHSRIKEDEEGEDNDSEDGSEDKKRKRKRKAKRHRFNKRKKKKLQEKAGKYSPRAASEDGSKGAASPVQDQDRFSDEAVESSGDEMVFLTPPAHGSAVLDMKVVGGYIMTASSDGTARCYDPATGQVMATYADHADLVTCIGVVGQPGYDAEATKFLVVTGSADRSVCVFNGQTGEVQQKREVGEVVRCLDISWGQLFLGTEGGCGARWNFKDKGVTEMVQFCGKAVTSMKAMTEGGRRVLLVAAKTTPLMIRDAMTGLFLRTLEHIQMTVYATVSYGGLLYSGGSEKIIVYYDFTSGSSRGHLESEADVSGLTVYRDYLLATCYDGLIRIFCLKTRKLLHRLSIETTNKMFICSALYKDRLLVGNKTGEVVECLIPAELKALPCPP